MKKLLSLVLVTMMIVISASTMVAFAEVGTPTWNGTTLTWGADATATSYTVNLYNTGYLVNTVNVADATSYDFASDMTAYGSYFATVTPAGGTASAYSANNVVGTNLAMSALQKLDDAVTTGKTLATGLTDGDATVNVYQYYSGNDPEKGIRLQLCDDSHLATVTRYAIATYYTVGAQKADLYYSQDGTEWTKADAKFVQSNGSSVADCSLYTLSTPVSCRWVKLVTQYSSTSKQSVNEIAVFGDVASYVPLDSIKMDDADLAGFDSNQTSYSVDLIEGAAIPTISATTAVEGAIVDVVQATSENPVATITSTKGEAVMTYTVNFNIIPAWKYYNLAQGKSVTSSSGFYGSTPATYALDGNLATAASTGNSGTMVIDMGTSVKIGSIGIIEHVDNAIFNNVTISYSDTNEENSWTEITLKNDYSRIMGLVGSSNQRINICEVGEINARYYKVVTKKAIDELLLFPVQEFSYEASFSALTRGEKPTATFTATNDKIYDVPANCTCIFAIYKDGELFDIVADDIDETVTGGTSEVIASFTANKVLPEDGVITVKGFIWNTETLAPLTVVFEP